MQQRILNMIEGEVSGEMTVQTRLSFRPFIDYLRARIQEEHTLKRDLLHYALEKFNNFPELEQDITLEDLGRYREIFDMIYILLSNMLEDEADLLWGISVPMTPLVFYGTDSFYELLNKSNQQMRDGAYTLDESVFRRQKHEHFYSYILEHFYGLKFRSANGIVKNIVDASTGLTSHYRVHIDSRFLEVTADRELPKLGSELVGATLLGPEAIATLEKLLPPEMFSFRGFSNVSITDVTAEYALAALRDQVATPGQPQFPAISRSLNELVGTNEVEFNILPMFRINGKLVENLEAYGQSIIFASGVDRDHCMPLIEKFVQSPSIIYFKDLDKEVPAFAEMSQVVAKMQIKSYSLLPVHYNGRLVGAIEMYSCRKGVLDKKLFTSLEPALILVSHLLQNSLNAFQSEIESVIKERFTNLQPAVQWKFNEAAWNFIQRKSRVQENVEPEEISFDGVYPLYGAVDIRNSTVERNAALNQDLGVQFSILIDVLQELKAKTGFELIEEKLFACRQWMDKISDPESAFNDEIALNDFIENDVTPFLTQFTQSRPELTAIAAKYFAAIHEESGHAYANRRQLEESMNTVITSVNTYFDLLKDQVQNAFPVYFEKFRTDGVEYDIYIGQSITPDRVYTELYLRNLRLMQLTSMVTIATNTRSLIPQLARPVQTTQLIFIHSHTIDIRFRKDEKRFDVEGAYNIRYHIIKKRIDKVKVRSTGERLTQPDKIALVYFNQKEADEYVGYIHYLQGEKLLEDNLEYLDLEDLQGVSGLRAMRVGIAVDKKAD